MATVAFKPGFRLSALDILVLCVGTMLAVVLWQQTWWFGFIGAFVTGHFFLFCNVIRMARPLELVWSAVFACLAGSTITAETPGWPATISISLLATAIVVAVELRKPSYHGIGWQQINPGLPAWWESYLASQGLGKTGD